MLHLIALASLLCCILICTYAQIPKTYQEDIVNNWPKNTKCCVPMKNTTDKLTVGYGFNLVDVVDFDMKTGIGMFILWERLTWKDYRLAWDKSAHNGVSIVRVNSDEIWTPDMVFFNSLNSELHRRVVNIVVSSDGTAIWVPVTKLKFRCKVENKQQFKCTFKVGAWTFNGNMVDIEHYPGYESIDDIAFNKHNNYKIIENVAVREVTYYEGYSADPYRKMIFNLTMEYSSGFAVKAFPMIVVAIVSMNWLI